MIVKEKWAWFPVKTESGKRIWWNAYISTEKKIWGVAGEGPVYDMKKYSKKEWVLYLLKNKH